jgi:hypothetical protein
MLSLDQNSANRGETRDSLKEVLMAKWKNNVKGVLNQRVRLGFLSVPLWVAGAVFLARTVKNRRQQRLAA